MTHSSFDQPLANAAMANAAWPYGPDGQPLKEGAHVYPEVTPDGLWTTPTDLARLVLQVQTSLGGSHEGELAQATAQEMLEPGGLADWGMGWGLGGSGDTRYFWHSGSNAGFKSMLFAYRDGEGLVIMTNSDAGERLAVELARTIAYEYGWPDFRPFEIKAIPLKAQQLDSLVGRFRIGRYALLSISRQGDKLFAATPDRPSFRSIRGALRTGSPSLRMGSPPTPTFSLPSGLPPVGLPVSPCAWTATTRWRRGLTMPRSGRSRRRSPPGSPPRLPRPARRPR